VPHHPGDLLERHGEHVVQHERESLRRLEGVQHDEQREADRVGELSLLGRVDSVAGLHDRVGHPHVERVLAPGRPRAQHVQAQPRNDRGEPTADIVHVLARRAGDPQPGFLDRVLGLGERAQHPVGDRPQAGSVLLEPRYPELFVLHCHILSTRRVTSIGPAGKGGRDTRRT